MINGKTILAIIPARGGSKGLPGKNIKVIAGKPLIAWTIEEAKKSKYIDSFILSSDDEEIISVAKEWGCEVPFKRPKEFSQDDSPSIDFILHAIETLEIKYDYICLLQPTSPLRSVENIDKCIEKCVKNNVNSCVSITEVDKHPNWMYSIEKDGTLKSFNEETIAIRRQDLSEVYSLNGAIYIVKTDALIKEKQLILKDTIGYIMDKENSVDIDTKLDFQFAELLLKEKRKNES